MLVSGAAGRATGCGYSSVSPCCPERLRSSRQWTSWVSGWRHSRIRYSKPGSSTIGIGSGEAGATAPTTILASVRQAEKNVKAAEDEMPGLREAVEKAAEAERIAHHDASEAVIYLHACEDTLVHARQRKVPAAEEALAIEKLRDAQAVAQRRQDAYDAALAETRAARKALRDGQGTVTSAKDALEDARRQAAKPGPAPRSMWTLGLLGPWMLLWGPRLNDSEQAAVREIVLAMASLCGVDRILANRERNKVEAEIRESRARVIQSLSKRGPRIEPPTGHDVWHAGALPAGVVQS